MLEQGLKTELLTRSLNLEIYKDKLHLNTFIYVVLLVLFDRHLFHQNPKKVIKFEYKTVVLFLNKLDLLFSVVCHGIN